MKPLTTLAPSMDLEQRRHRRDDIPWVTRTRPADDLQLGDEIRGAAEVVEVAEEEERAGGDVGDVAAFAVGGDGGGLRGDG